MIKTTKDEALKLALEALEKIGLRDWVERKEEAITAIREALMSVPDGAHAPTEREQPAQDDPCIDGSCSCCWSHLDGGPAQQVRWPWRNAAIRVGEELSSVGPNGYYNMTADQWLAWAMDQQPRGKNSLAEQPAQNAPPTVAELLCVCGAEWEWRNRDWELVATPPAPAPEVREQQDPNYSICPTCGGMASDPIVPPSDRLTSKPWVHATMWRGLTDEEFQWIYDNGRTPAGMMEMAEAKLKEKNGF